MCARYLCAPMRTLHTRHARHFREPKLDAAERQALPRDLLHQRRGFFRICVSGLRRVVDEKYRNSWVRAFGSELVPHSTTACPCLSSLLFSVTDPPQPCALRNPPDPFLDTLSEFLGAATCKAQPAVDLADVFTFTPASR